MSRPDSIQSRMRRLVVIFCAFMAALFIVMLALALAYNSQYTGLLYNVTTASEFNQDFKENIDLKMYYYVIESQYSEGLPIEEVEAAQRLAKDLLSTTSQKDSLRAVTSVLDLCENLEEKIYQIEATRNYDDRQMQLENNIYVLTSLIQEYMYNYLYCESVQLNLLQQQIARQIAAEILLVLVLSAVSILLLVRYSVRLSRSVTQPVVDLCRRAEDVIGGDLTVREPVRSETYEIRTLSKGMEQMIARINTQIQEITQKQTSLRKTELALLQAQINPHFLYNTMDTIIWLIEADRPQAAVEMVSNLANFFRRSLSQGEDVITLGEEERHVRSYLQIQQARYQDILDYSINIESALQKIRIPKLTLQPLVENALYHGIKLKRGKGCISIASRVEGTDVLIQITDDGAGMSENRLSELNQAMGTGKRVGFGLVTVHERLRLLFGAPYGLTLESRQGAGTTVTVRIPRPAEKEVEI
ncbi:sensor histidine kinase [uncultured Oscillibacter sp.]|uniref:sensor histidine kinase n=1 Tax=uncultured Oscillibacter sp. TaxID=876091 RepID=UPI0025E1F23C|nr:sensor histidine kinase [uncultured Oscillibacter sp.]